MFFSCAHFIQKLMTPKSSNTDGF